MLSRLLRSHRLLKTSTNKSSCKILVQHSTVLIKSLHILNCTIESPAVSFQPYAMANQAADTGNVKRGVTDDPLVWIDCEMTGLNPDTEEIIEIFCIITTGNLEIIDNDGFHAIIHLPKSRMDQMDEWCTKTHANSGLTQAVIESSTTADEAADSLYKYITKFIPEERKGLLAGNSIHADRMFLRKEPYAKVLDHLHYRLIDVTSIKEAARRWAAPSVTKKVPNKKGHHKARDDILESIEEARYYRDVIFGRTLEVQKK